MSGDNLAGEASWISPGTRALFKTRGATRSG
jgi:hypothetical protein